MTVIQRLSVADQIYGELRNRILRGDLAQGSRVVEAQLAKSLGVSRAPIREAVNRLTEAGLLESRTHIGTTVVQMTAEKLRKLYLVRVAVECQAIREVVSQPGARDTSVLKGHIKEMHRFAKAKDLQGLVASELAFHQAMWELADNPYVDRVAGLIADHVRLALAVDNAGYGELSQVADEHELLVRMIEGNDPEAAAAALADHIMASLESAVRAQPVAAEG